MRYYVDFRFIVEAKDQTEACEKVEALVSDATEDVQYTVANVIPIKSKT